MIAARGIEMTERDKEDWVDRKFQLTFKHLWAVAVGVFYLGMQAAGFLALVNRVAQAEDDIEGRATVEQVNEVHADMTIYIDRGDDELKATDSVMVRRVQNALDRAAANRDGREAMNVELQILKTRFELSP